MSISVPITLRKLTESKIEKEWVYYCRIYEKVLSLKWIRETGPQWDTIFAYNRLEKIEQSGNIPSIGVDVDNWISYLFLVGI